MAKSASAPTRIAADVVASASAVAVAENRSVAEQVNYWTRLGMQVERSASATSRCVMGAITGTSQFSELSEEERAAAHAVIDSRIAERVAGQSFGSAARMAGHTTVSIDDSGSLIEISPDGSRRLL